MDDREGQKLIRVLLRKAREAAQLVANPCDRVPVYLSIFKVSGRLGDYRSAIRSFPRRRLESEHALLDIVRALVHVGNFREARRMAQREADPYHLLEAYGIIYRTTKDHLDFEACRQAVARGQRSQFPSLLAREMTLIRARAGDPRAALAVAETEDFRSPFREATEPDDHIIARELATAGQLRTARRFVRRCTYWPYRRVELTLLIHQVSENPHDLAVARKYAREIRRDAFDRRQRVRSWLGIFAASHDLSDLKVPRREADEPAQRAGVFAAAFSVSRDPTDLTFAKNAASEISRQHSRWHDEQVPAYIGIFRASGAPEDLIVARNAAMGSLHRAEALRMIYEVSGDVSDLQASLNAKDEEITRPGLFSKRSWPSLKRSAAVLVAEHILALARAVKTSRC